jgi:type III pantothenate kinase
MNPDVVVDVGNSRIKWGLCDANGVTAMVSLGPDDAAAWTEQTERWELRPGRSWILAGVHPARRDALADWLKQRGDEVRMIDSSRQLPLKVELAEPEKVGLDRLLNAVAANVVRYPARPAVIIDAGSAVTVDYVDANGAFRGGAILPGFRLMAQALHDHTALLPVVTIDRAPAVLCTNTTAAMQAGIFWSIVGGLRTLTEKLGSGGTPTEVFLTGGDAGKIAPELQGCRLVPTLTLDGIWRTALQGALRDRTS